MFSKLFGRKKSEADKPATPKKPEADKSATSKKSKTDQSATSKGKKKGGYYLELLDEAETNRPTTVPTDQSIVQEAAEKLPEPESTPEKPSVEETKSEPAKAEAETQAEASKKTKKTSLKSSKSAPKTTQVEQQNSVTTSTPAAQTNPSSSNGQVEPKTAEFATKYLITQTLSRRRPGPSLNPFKEMARQVKTTNR